MPDQVNQALNYLSNHDVVSMRYIDRHPDHPLGKGGGELAIGHANEYKKYEEKILLPPSRTGTAKIISEVMGSIANRKAILVVDDLHHILNRIHNRKNTRFPDMVLDVSFAKSFLGYDTDISIETLMLSTETNLSRLGMMLFQQLNKRARKHYKEVYIPMIKSYVDIEVEKVRVMRDGIPHHAFIQYEMHGTSTGRLISKGKQDGSGTLFCPHFATIASRSSLIRAKPGSNIVSVDYNAAEIAVAAWFSGDIRALDMIKDGQDVYGFLGEKSGVQRKAAKSMMVRWINGSGKTRMIKGLDLSEDDASKFVRVIKSNFPDIVRWTEEITDKVRESQGPDGEHFLRTPTGRVLRFDREKAENRARQVGPNSLMQSFNADLNSATYSEIIRTFYSDLDRVKPLIHLHDGYIFEVNSGALEDDLAAIVDIAKKVPLPYLPNGDSLFMNVKTVVGECWE